MDKLNLLVELSAYTKNIYNRNLKQLSGNILEENDFIAMAYEKGFDTIEQAIKIVRDAIITEKRLVIAKIQQRGNRLNIHHKVCNKCKDLKSVQEFAPRIDKRTGFKYFNNLCHECERERRRIALAKSGKMRASAHRRYLNSNNVIPKNIHNQKSFLLPDSPRSMASYHAKVMNDGIMKLTIHDCKSSIQLHNDLNNPEEITEALQKLSALATGIIELQDFIYQNYAV